MEILRFIAISLISGITAVIPGVSGGTIFAIFGISEHMATDINGVVQSLSLITKSVPKMIKEIFRYGKLPFIIGIGSLISSLFYSN